MFIIFRLIFRRVHISEKTLGFLNGEFEVERAYGEKREETLRIAGLKTYFITKVIVPVSSLYFFHIFRKTLFNFEFRNRYLFGMQHKI